MGYRNYLYKIKKKDVNKIKNLTLEEIKSKYGNKDEDDYVNIDDLLENYKTKVLNNKLYYHLNDILELGYRLTKKNAISLLSWANNMLKKPSIKNKIDHNTMETVQYFS